jgi:hypothetical protein
MELFMSLGNPLDDLLLLVDDVIELGRSMCAACGAVRKDPKRRPLPSPLDVPVRVKMPRGEPHAGLQAIVNMNAGYEVCPVPPPAEVEPERYPFDLTTVTVQPVATTQMRNKWASASLDKIQARLEEVQVLIGDNELDLARALREGKSKKIETAEASLSWFLHHRMMLESLVAMKILSAY